MALHREKFIPWLVLVFLAALYLATIAPDLTWAYDGADGGDLIGAAATGGVPHPTGYPTYILLLSLFLKLPMGTPAFRGNLMSLVFTLLAAWMVYRTAVAAGGGTLSAALACLVFGATPLVWSQAIITEVYALHAFFITLLLYASLRSPQWRGFDFLLGLLLGLALGNHVTSLLMLPIVLTARAGFTSPPPGARNPQAWKTSLLQLLKKIPARIGGISLGVCIYGALLLRAQSLAPVNWGYAVDFESLVRLVSGQMYQGRLEHLSAGYLLSGFTNLSQFLMEQFTPCGILLIAITLAGVFRRTPFFLYTAWIAVVSIVFAVVYYAADSYVYLLPAMLSFSLWIGYAGAYCINLLQKKHAVAAKVAMVLLFALISARTLAAVPRMTLANDHRPRDFAMKLLAATPQNAVLLAQGDEATFALWYFLYVERLRGDVKIISRDLYIQSWYRKVIGDTYPQLSLPDTPWVETFSLANKDQVICQVALDSLPPLQCE